VSAQKGEEARKVREKREEVGWKKGEGVTNLRYA
jgi:hypothetical protein